MSEPILEIDEYGNQYWRLNNKLHREDGPAAILNTDSKMWYIKGFRHREDGPAIEWFNGEKEYWIDGVKCTEFEFFVKTGNGN